MIGIARRNGRYNDYRSDHRRAMQHSFGVPDWQVPIDRDRFVNQGTLGPRFAHNRRHPTVLLRPQLGWQVLALCHGSVRFLREREREREKLQQKKSGQKQNGKIQLETEANSTKHHGVDTSEESPSSTNLERHPGSIDDAMAAASSIVTPWLLISANQRFDWPRRAQDLKQRDSQMVSFHIFQNPRTDAM